MKKILGILAAIIVLHALAAGAFVAWFAAARMNPQYADALGRMLRGEKLAAAESESPTSRPATQPAVPGGDLAAREIITLREADLAYSQLAHVRQGVDSELARLKADREKLDKESQAWADRKQALAKERQQAGFRQVLALYESMKPLEVKEIWTGLNEDVLVALVKEMDASKVAKILQEFRDPAELETKRKVLEKIRVGEQGDLAGAAALAKN
jgi:flagellar motility protein MotE (MotC chaperone)